jgi:hypothetical protein
MSDILSTDASTNTDPHAQFILHKILLLYGIRHPPFLRSRKKWRPLIPMLMDHLLVEVDPDTEDWAGSASGHSAAGSGRAVGSMTPIETKLRQLSVDALYQISRVQKFDMCDLGRFYHLLFCVSL